MSDALRAAIILPEIIGMYYADVVLRLIDLGKWSDVMRFLTLIGGGRVLNICGRLRLWGSSDSFSGLSVLVRVLKSSRPDQGGRVIVRAGADPSFNANSTVAKLRDGSFDHGELALCVLSTLDFSSLAGYDLEITILSPIPPGASVGTSAAMCAALNYAFLGLAHDPLDIAMRSLKAELEICKKTSGNQDQLASSFGSQAKVVSPVIMIDVRNIYDVDVVSVPVGPRISKYLGNTVVAFTGGHDSSQIHEELGVHLSENPVLARELLIGIRDTADQAKRAFELDDPSLFVSAFAAGCTAQRNLSPKLISANADKLMALASEVGGATVVPGAGGHGGSVVSCFETRESANDYVATAKMALPDVRFYEACCPGLPGSEN